MTREEQIKQYCADQGFPYGACSGISSVKATVATEAIKWADEHPNGSLIKWQTGEPKEDGLYIVTTNQGEMAVTGYFPTLNKGEKEKFNMYISAWCPLSDIEPYKLKEEQPC